MTDRVVLAYSGGLDTSVAIPYLAKMTGGEVVAVSLDLGQGGEDMESVRQRALDCGAVESIVVDAKDEFAEEYCLPTIKANGMYMKQYPLVSAISRPLIVKHLVEAAREHGGTHVAHGCTGKGNDQVRFEVGFANTHPDLKIIAPARDYAWTRDKAIAFAEEIDLPIEQSKNHRFPSTRTCGDAPSKQVSLKTCGTRQQKTSTPTLKTRRWATRPMRSLSPSKVAPRLPLTAALSPFSKPSKNSIAVAARRVSVASIWWKTD